MCGARAGVSEHRARDGGPTTLYCMVSPTCKYAPIYCLGRYADPVVRACTSYGPDTKSNKVS